MNIEKLNVHISLFQHYLAGESSAIVLSEEAVWRPQRGMLLNLIELKGQSPGSTLVPTKRELIVRITDVCHPDYVSEIVGQKTPCWLISFQIIYRENCDA